MDGCFANAGVSGWMTRFEDMTTEEWNHVLNVNLNGVFYIFRLAARHMKARAEQGDPFGRLIATSSSASIFGQPRGEHYSATKGALNAMVRSLAVEYARYGMTAHAILPGWITTEMTDPLKGMDKMHAAINARIPAKRWGEAEDFEGIAVYLMSEASKYHSAGIHVIDGGFTVF